MSQQALFDDVYRTPEQRTITERFLEFHHAHPEVYAALVRMAREARVAGQERVGMKMLFEVLRWQSIIGGGGGFRLDNVYTSRYARLIMDRCPDLDGVFETRELSSP